MKPIVTRVTTLTTASTVTMYDDTVYGSVSVPKTGGWQTWMTVSHQVTLAAGQQQIAVKALAGGFNLNWLKLTK